MDKIKAACVGIIAADAIINTIIFFTSGKEAEKDKLLTDALLANREAVVKKNELLEKEVEALKQLLELALRKSGKEEQDEY